MTSYRFGDVVLVPFPFTDQSSTKRRPAVVVSSETLHRETADLVIMAITSQPRALAQLEVPITLWKEAGLMRQSVIKPVLATIERKLVIKKLWKLQDDDLKALRPALNKILG